MFSFHKPKVYRSTTGCCICKAKSSSSRFTDSKKYESDFKECFLLIEPRQGEICNACVLLVKRFKRLPLGNRRHWSHVVDARIGPGIKSMSKCKKRKEVQMLQQNASSTEFAGQSNSNAQNIRNNTVSERFGKIFKKIQKKKLIPIQACDENSHPTSSSSSSDNEENRISDDASDDRLECDEDMNSIIGESITNRRNQRKQANPIKNENQTLHQHLHVIDPNIWSQRQSCCGSVYESKKFGAIMVEINEFSVRPCSIHAKQVPSTSSSSSSSSASTSPVSENTAELSSAIKLPRKKQLLRQCFIDAAPALEPVEQAAPIDYSKQSSSKPITNAAQINDANRIPPNNLNKVRGNTGKVAKKTPKKNLSSIKNLVKLCTSQKIVNATAAAAAAAKSSLAPLNAAIKLVEQNVVGEHNENQNITNTTTKATEPIVNKFSDNSSDSGIDAGYDETLHDTNQLKQIANIGTSRPVILSNGVLLHVKNRENLLRAAKIAGVSQTVIQTTQANMKAMNAQTFQENAPSYKCITPAHEVSKTGVYMVTPSV